MADEKIERGARRIVERGTLPRSYPKGARKAFYRFQFFYGPTQGRRIFIEKAIEQGTGDTIRERVSSVYKKGAKLK